MPSVQEWQEALSREYSVSFDSSADLCDEVYHAHRQKNRDRLRRGLRPVRTKSIPPFPLGNPGQQILRPVKPVDVLHAIGVVTTPAIIQLVDLSSTPGP